ncbi:complex immune system [Drosophila suzukii associated hytrosavirus 1]|nr:complex immune system [Drosophila suzukii associated hytrosavirus 1]
MPDDTKLSEKDIEKLLKTEFPNLSDANLSTLAHYMYKFPKKWSKETLKVDANKLMPEAYAYNMRPSNALFGAIIAIIVILLIGVIWWVVAIFMKKNNKNVLGNPVGVNPEYM